jgi:eukaryotic-like serine/threonine-protein kinase
LVIHRRSGTVNVPTDPWLALEITRQTLQCPAQNTSPMYPQAFLPLEIGSKFAGRFRIVRLVGAGGMGAVYEAESLKGLANRAIKVLRQPPELKEEKFRELFCLEATILCKLPQDHVVQVFDFGLDEKTKLPFIEMELLKGENLAARVRPGRGLPPEYLLMLLGQTARTLDAINDRGVVHRDIKPENLVVVLDDNLEPTIKIIDFGIAKTVTTGANPATTGLKGTPWYVAPEQIIGKNLSGATDRYALAQVAFTLLTGEPYWSGTQEYSHNLAQMFLAMDQRRCMSASERVRLLNAQLAEWYGRVEPVVLPPEFDEWFARATEFEPQRRFGSAREMIEKLATLLLGWRAVEVHAPNVAQVASELQAPAPNASVGARPAAESQPYQTEAPSALVEARRSVASNDEVRPASKVEAQFGHSPNTVMETVSSVGALHPRAAANGSKRWAIALATLGAVASGSLVVRMVVRQPAVEPAAPVGLVVSTNAASPQASIGASIGNIIVVSPVPTSEGIASAVALPAAPRATPAVVNPRTEIARPNEGLGGKRAPTAGLSSGPLRTKQATGGTGNAGKSTAVNPVDELR